MDRHYQRKGHSPATAVLILLCALLGIFLFCTSQWGQSIADEHIAPVAEKVMNYLLPTATPDTAAAMSTLATNSPAPSPAINTIDWELPESSWYILEMGVFTTERQAMEQSAQLQAMGAAGYMYTDEEGRIRLLAAGYREQEDALQVQKQIIESGFTASPYNFHLAGLKCRLSGEEKNLSIIQGALNTACELPGAITDYALRFDRENLPVQTGQEQISQWLETLMSAEAALQPYGSDEPLKSFYAYMGEVKSVLSTFLQKDDTITQTECAAALKYAQIAVLSAFKTLTEGLVT